MKRSIALLTLAIMLALSVAGCGGDAEPVTADDTETAPAETAPAGDAAPEGLQAIATDGPGEAAALAAVPAALEDGKAMQESAGQPWTDVTGVEPRLIAYILAVDMDGQTTLLETRADGLPHSLYAYQRAFDAGSLLWGPAENSSSPRTAPQSDTEKAAVAAAEAAMIDSFPEGGFTVSVYGYRFVFLDAETPLVTLEVDTSGSLISIGN